MNPGRLNRRIVVQARTLGADATGARTETWADSFTCWAEQVNQSQREAIVADSDRNQDNTTFRIRWRTGLTSEGYRVSYGGRKFDILGITEEGIKTFMLLDCQAIKSLNL